MSDNTVTHPALTVLTALLAGETITEPSGRRVCLGYDPEHADRRALAIVADRERPGHAPDTVLLPLDVTVTDFIEWAATLPVPALPPAPTPPADPDPLHIGDFGLADVQDAVPELTAAECLALLAEHQDELEESLGAHFEFTVRDFLRARWHYADDALAAAIAAGQPGWPPADDDAEDDAAEDEECADVYADA